MISFFQIFSINSDAESLISFYPDAVDHIMAKRRELLRAIEKLDSKVKERDEMVSGKFYRNGASVKIRCFNVLLCTWTIHLASVI